MSTRTGKGRKRRKPDNPAQSARFMEAAKALGADPKGKAFKDAMDKLLPPKKPKRGSS